VQRWATNRGANRGCSGVPLLRGERKSPAKRGFCSAPGEIRTPDLRFRRPTLYPAELRALAESVANHRSDPRTRPPRAQPPRAAGQDRVVQSGKVRPLMALRVRGPALMTGACLVAVTLGGCGSSPNQASKAQIRNVVHAFLRAQVNGDGPAACAQLTSTGQAELVALVQTAARGVLTVQPSCPRAVRLLRKIVGVSLLSSLEHLRVKRIRIFGLAARARVADRGRFPPQVLTFQELGGVWRISSVRG
jgi:hypothetical protein